MARALMKPCNFVNSYGSWQFIAAGSFYQSIIMEKTDLTKKYKSYYTAKTKPEMVTVEPAQYLSIEGKGDPSSAAFAERIQALYTVAYAIKFLCKASGNDFVVAKLEGLWWYDEEQYKELTIEDAPTRIPRSEWYYKLLIRLPEFVTTVHVDLGIAAAVEKKQVVLANNIELYRTNEEKAVQIMHIGPFDKEPESLLQLKAFMGANDLSRNGLHHEIYLSDFRKTAPEKLKTILREPVK